MSFIVKAYFVVPSLFLVLACSQQSAAASESQWLSVGRSDVANTPDLKLRDSKTLNFQAAGDFNGDGTREIAYVRKNRTSSSYGVVVCLSTSNGACAETVLATGPIAHLASLGIQTIPSSKTAALISQSLAAKQKPGNAKPGADGLEIFAFEASSALYQWNGARFDVVELAD